MNKLKDFINDHFITDNLPFESRILNFVCLFGAMASCAAIISRIIAGLPFITIAPLLVMIVSISAILFISIKGERYASVLTTIIVCGVSIVFWPILFFTIGGPHSGMAVYFTLAIILDSILLKGKTRVFALLATLAVTIFCYISTLFLGWSFLPKGGLTAYQVFLDKMQSIVIVGFYVSFIILFQTRLYKDEKNKVEAANIERNESLQQLKSAQLTMYAMFDSNPHINVLFDSNFNVVDCNPVAYKFMGFDSKKDLLNGFIERMVSSIPKLQPDGRPSIPLPERLITTVKEGHVNFQTELHLSDGVIRNLDVEFKKIPYGDSFAIVGYVYDMSEIHRREMELRHARELIDVQLDKLNMAVSELESAQLTVSAMFESNPHINILFDSTFKVIDCNPAAVEFMGFKTKEDMLAGFAERLVNSIPESISTGRTTRPVSEWFMTAVENGFVKFETEFILSGVTHNVNIELKKIPYGDSFAIVGYILDMTEVHEREMELKRRDQQLFEAMEEAKAANLAKSSFLATMSHEIRTPMNAILGITEIQLQRETLDQDVRDAFNRISVSGDILLGIINDILDLSKIEAGRLELAIDRYEIASLISDTAQLNMMRIGSKPIDFELNIDETIPAILSGDELRVKQIMNNILSNAFKYTAAGTVNLSVSTEPCNGNDDNITLIISVSDTGQGMTKEQINQLFDEYSRFNMSANRSTEGTGLGMSITQNLVRLMNGEMNVKSEPDKGSTFTVRLPQIKIGSGILGTELAENLQHFRTSSRAQMKRVQITREPMPYGSVLVVDDVETNIYVVKGLLAPYGLKTDSADSGFAAIEKIKSGGSYDIVFMDHMMPKMDGIETTKIIRDMGYTRPIVALTANAVSGQADIFLGNGFDDYISKPIDIRQLNSVLNKLIRDKQPPEVLETLKQQADATNKQLSEKAPQQAIDQRFAEIFVRDANKSLAVLREIMEKGSLRYNGNDMQTYTIYVHGMKSALANIGKMELSAVALKLETLSRHSDIETILSETPAFIDALQALTEELIPKKEPAEAGTGKEDLPLLRERLLVIKAACEEFDKNTVYDTLTELRARPWSQPTKDLLTSAGELLLHSDFDDIINAVNSFMKSL